MIQPSTKGCICNECGQHVKLYKRQIYSTMARALIRLYKLQKEDPGQFVHLKKFWFENGTDFTKFAHWGLIEALPNVTDPEKKGNGFWRMTPHGVLFARNHLAVPKIALIYNAKVFGFEGPNVFISDCLTKKFSYGELMNE